MAMKNDTLPHPHPPTRLPGRHRPARTRPADRPAEGTVPGGTWAVSGAAPSAVRCTAAPSGPPLLTATPLHFTSLPFASLHRRPRGLRGAMPAEPSRAERGPEREPRREWGAHGCCDWPRCQRRPLIGCGGAGGGRLWRPGGCDGVRPAWPPLRFVPLRPGRVVCGR